MSKPAPRKPRHTRHPSNRIAVVSDYDSDAVALPSSYDYAPPPRSRTNTELNLSVLQRYLPSIHTILSIAANAVIYTFDPSGQQWNKSGIEGTMFVCAQSSLPDDPQLHPRGCVFVLSRRGLENIVIDLAKVNHVEIAEELVILRVDGEQQEGDKVLGIWIHNDKDETRAVNGATIQESWRVVRSEGATDTHGVEAGPAMQAIGSGGLSVNDLFSGHNDKQSAH